MIVTFRTRSYPDIVMFGDIAKHLLREMGHSGTVPSAIQPADIPAALDRLKRALEMEAEQPEAGDDEAPPISLRTRALPLIRLLEAAQAEDDPVMWD